MHEHLLIGFSLVFIFGLIAQWLAWKLRLPSILMLLVFGLFAGPILGWVETDLLLGDVLRPFISLAVAIILFEGGLSLKLEELRETHTVVRNLLSVGVMVTWILITLFGVYILALDWPLALLLGAILVVTGPTVVGPLLRHLHLKGQINSIAKWEGIVIDPIGALLAVLVYEGIFLAQPQDVPMIFVLGILKTIFIASMIGILGAYLMVLLIKHRQIPDFLSQSFSLAIVLGIFTLANLIQDESGLLAVTVMGIVLANQRVVNIRNIEEFKESLRNLLISILFILLAARLDWVDLEALSWRSAFFLMALIFVVRPLAVFISTRNTKLNWREKVFLSWMAPRGIVAAAISSLTAIQLVDAGYEQARVLVPETFLVIMGTIVIYGLTAPMLSRALGLNKVAPQGVLIVGAHDWACQFALALKEHKIMVMLVDTNLDHVRKAWMDGLPAISTNILAESAQDKLDFNDIGYLVAMTPNDEVNTLTTFRYLEVLEADHLYQLQPHISRGAKRKKKELLSQSLCGRIAFSHDINYENLEEWFKQGAEIQSLALSDAENAALVQELTDSDRLVPLCYITEDRELVLVTPDSPHKPKSSDTLMGLVLPGHSRRASDTGMEAGEGEAPPE